jgi:predicted GIY-YIG superfamily endonuclease
MEVAVCIVRCADGSYYTGLTKQDVDARVWEHNNDPVDGYAATQSNWCLWKSTSGSPMRYHESVKSKVGAAPRKKL